MTEISDELQLKMNQLLDGRELEVMHLRLGVAAGRPQTLQEIGNSLGITRERVRQIQFRALRKLGDKNLNEKLMMSSILSPEKKIKTKTQIGVELRNVKLQVQPTEELISIWFSEPLSGIDPLDGEVILSTRHWVSASWAKQDAAETLFLNDEGTIVAKFPTNLIESIKWPTGETVKATVEAFKNRMDEIKTLYPKAWSRWPEEEDSKLREEFEGRISLDDLCLSHQRAVGGICARLKKLGLVDESLNNWQIMDLIESRRVL